MKRLFAITALMSGLWCGTANAQNVAPNVNPQSIGPVDVSLVDNMSDACWTNLRDVREYAEEKLHMSGYSTRGNQLELGRYTLRVLAVGYRSNGQCVGTVTVEIAAVIDFGGVRGFHVVGQVTGIATRGSNLNNYVITKVQELIDEM